jgi:REP element-mobilizing transposase RayT
MANTYTQIHIHAVFAVKGRESLISFKWKDELYKYISGIVSNCGHKLLAVGGMPDHIHLLIGLRPVQSLSDLMQDIKGSSSKWINENRFVTGRFSWQEGYGAFSYKKGDLPGVMNYIYNQEIHHGGRSLCEEYKILLDEFGVDYDERFVFKSTGYDYPVPDGTVE